MDASFFKPTELTTEQLIEHDRVFGELAAAARNLVDAILHTRVEHPEVVEVTAEVDALARRLRKESDPSSLGVTVTPDGVRHNPGNAVVGVRNPIAPPVVIERKDDGTATASFHLGAAFEGPPHLVHGGVSAMILDQMLGEAAAAAGAPGMTGRLEVTYRRPTPLGDLSATAWVHEVDGYKTTVRGQILGPDGEPTVEAEGLFIVPRWAREAVAAAQQGRQPFE